MKILYYPIFYSFLAIIQYSCDTKQASEPASESVSRAVSATYKAPVFENDDRIEKIKGIAPELQNLIVEHAKSNNIPGVAYGIVVDNELVVASATGFANLEEKAAASTKSAFRIASMTKSFTAMAIIKLRDEGKLSLNDPVSKYVPAVSRLEYLTEDSPTIDIENLLTMTAGFPEDNPWGDRQLDEPDQMLLDLFDEGVSFSNAASFEFEYSNTAYALLGHIISKVSGLAYQEYIKINILEPLGMDQTYWEYDRVPKTQLVLGYRWEDAQWKSEPMLHDGSFGAMGGLITTIEDFSKYVGFCLSAWPPRSGADNGPVKRSSLREMQTPQFVSLNADEKDSKGNACAMMSGYGFGLGVTTYCNGLKQVGHGGALPGFGSDFRFYPEYGIGIMAFCNLTYTSAYPRSKITELLFETLALKPRTLPVSETLLERQQQVVELIKHWNADLESKILAENFYLDRSRAHRMAEAKEIVLKAGTIQSIGEIDPNNQLRGSFKIMAENGVVNIFFTLTPEKYAKVQRLDIAFEPNETM